jgi:GT2 family glycosyltransferase
VAVIDNDSTDGSAAFVAERFPGVQVIGRPNWGLCSFNAVVTALQSPVVVLLNNDIKLAPDSIDPLVAPLRSDLRCFMTAPLCWRFDGRTYEGFRTAVRWRMGLVQATALFEGHETGVYRPGLTASAGAALAVDRRKFVELGGFDPIYLPGRLEDLDFCFRGYMAGYHARYVPKSVAYHRGMATFGEVYGPSACEQLALRNTLLFQWKNLRHPRHVARQLFGLPLRFVQDAWRAPWLPREHRWAFVRAFCGALSRLRQVYADRCPAGSAGRRERKYFTRFHPVQLAQEVNRLETPTPSESLTTKEDTSPEGTTATTA